MYTVSLNSQTVGKTESVPSFIRHFVKPIRYLLSILQVTLASSIACSFPLAVCPHPLIVSDSIPCLLLLVHFLYFLKILCHIYLVANNVIWLSWNFINQVSFCFDVKSVESKTYHSSVVFWNLPNLKKYKSLLLINKLKIHLPKNYDLKIFKSICYSNRTFMNCFENTL